MYRNLHFEFFFVGAYRLPRQWFDTKIKAVNVNSQGETSGKLGELPRR